MLYRFLCLKHYLFNGRTIFKKEEELRKKNGLPTTKNFKDSDNSVNDSFWKN